MVLTSTTSASFRIFSAVTSFNLVEVNVGADNDAFAGDDEGDIADDDECDIVDDDDGAIADDIEGDAYGGDVDVDDDENSLGCIDDQS